MIAVAVGDATWQMRKQSATFQARSTPLGDPALRRYQAQLWCLLDLHEDGTS